VVGFSGTYHAILGRPAYTKFMVVPNYTYLKLKIPRLRGIIKVGPTYQRAYECDAECFLFAEATIRSVKLHAEPRSEDQDVPESSKCAANSFEPAKDVKDVVASDDGYKLRSVSGQHSILNRKARSLTSSKRTRRVRVETLRHEGIPREVAEHKLNIKPGSKPVKQHLRRFNDEKCKAIGEEIVKLLSEGFI
jgi:hypothetical protein